MNNPTSSTRTANDARYPESIYRNVTDEPVELSNGRIAAPLTRETAERIADTKPDWALFDDTDIAEFAAQEGELLNVWQLHIGEDVAITQDVIFNEAGEKLREDKPVLRVFVGDRAEFSDPDAARTLAQSLVDASAVLEEILPVKLAG